MSACISEPRTLLFAFSLTWCNISGRESKFEVFESISKQEASPKRLIRARRAPGGAGSPDSSQRIREKGASLEQREVGTEHMGQNEEPSFDS